MIEEKVKEMQTKLSMRKSFLLPSTKEPERNSNQSGIGVVENGQFGVESWHLLVL